MPYASDGCNCFHSSTARANSSSSPSSTTALAIVYGSPHALHAKSYPELVEPVLSLRPARTRYDEHLDRWAPLRGAPFVALAIPAFRQDLQPLARVLLQVLAHHLGCHPRHRAPFRLRPTVELRNQVLSDLGTVDFTPPEWLAGASSSARRIAAPNSPGPAVLAAPPAWDEPSAACAAGRAPRARPK